MLRRKKGEGSFGADRGRGERHVCRRSFEVVPIPRCRGSEMVHRMLARLGRRCHRRVRAFLRGAHKKVLGAASGPSGKRCETTYRKS
jgi:hypothetical protein